MPPLAYLQSRNQYAPVRKHRNIRHFYPSVKLRAEQSNRLLRSERSVEREDCRAEARPRHRRPGTFGFSGGSVPSLRILVASQLDTINAWRY